MLGIPLTKEFVTDLATSVGLVAISFAQFEFSLNNSMEIIFEHGGGRETIEPELQRNFKNRLDFMKRSAKELSKLAPFKDEVLDLMLRAADIAPKRDHIIHGYVANYDRKTKKLLFIKTTPDGPTKQTHKLDRLEITFPKLQSLATQTLDLSTQMSGPYHRLDKALVP